MSQPSSPPSLFLPAGRHLRCAEREPAVVEVVRGRVWVTHARDPHDHFLGPGESLRLPAGALALVGAEEAALVVLRPLPRRSQRWVPGATIGASPPPCPQT
jgi:hypothetical protein